MPKLRIVPGSWKPGQVVVLGDLVEAEGEVVPRPHPLGGVDRASLERREDLAAGKRHRGRAEAAQHLAAKARHAHLEALEVLERVDLLVEPAAPLDARVSGHQRLQVEAGAELVPELLAARMVDPGVDLGRGQPEGNRGEEVEGLGLALPVVLGGVVHVRRALRDGIEGFEGRHQLAGGEQLDRDAPFGPVGDAVGEALRAGAEAGEVLRPRGDHLELSRPLRDRRRGEAGRGRGRRRGGAGKRGPLEKAAAFDLRAHVGGSP